MKRLWFDFKRLILQSELAQEVMEWFGYKLQLRWIESTPVVDGKFTVYYHMGYERAL